MNRVWSPLVLIAAVGLLALATRAVVAQAPNPAPELVAVMDIEAVGASKNQSMAVSDRLREELLNSHRYKLVDRSEMSKILDEQAFQQAACTSQECAVKAGRVLGVRKLVTGRLNKVEDDLWLMSAMMVDVETAETLQAASIQLDGSFRNLLSEGVGRLAVKLGTPASAVTVSAVMQGPEGARNAKPTGGNIDVVGIGLDAEVFLNGLTRGSGPKRIAALIPGTYQLEVRRRGFHTWRQSVDLKGGASVALSPVFDRASVAVFPYIRTGSTGTWKSSGDWIGSAMMQAVQRTQAVKLTHSFYPAGKALMDLSRDEAIKKDTWTFFGNPNIELVSEKAKALGVDYVLLVKVTPDAVPGKKGGYKAYWYDTNSGLMHTDAGQWPYGPNGAPTVRKQVQDLISRSLTTG